MWVASSVAFVNTSPERLVCVNSSPRNSLSRAASFSGTGNGVESATGVHLFLHRQKLSASVDFDGWVDRPC